MYLCIDIGSSFTKAGFVSDTLEVENFYRYKNSEKFTLPSFLKCDKIMISSVNPEKLEEVRKVLKESSDLMPFIIDSNINLNFQINMKEPETLGADLIANSAAAAHYFPKYPTLVIDLGTAITFTIVDIVNGNHVFEGGMILPGLSSMENAFRDRFPTLTEDLNADDMPKYYPDNLLNSTTSGAVNAGLATMFYSPIMDNIAKFREQYPNLKVIITGGDTNQCQHIAGIDLASPNFTLQGMVVLGAL